MKRIFISAITILFLIQNIVGGVPILTETAPFINKDIFIPESYGFIEKSSFDKYFSSRFVVLLKDAHCNYDAQHNIAKILEVLIKEYKIDLIAIEGAIGDLDYSRFDKMENEPAREKMADSFVKKGILAGPEYLKIVRDGKLQFNIYGIENEKLYVENFVTFREAVNHQEEALLFINELSRIVKNLKSKIYPKELFEFDDKSMQYYENNISLTDWVKELRTTANKKGIRLNENPNIMLTFDSIALEEKIDFKKVETERANAIGDIEEALSGEGLKEMVSRSLQFRLGRISSSDYYGYLEKLLESLSGADPAEKFPNLTKYIQLVKLQTWINSNALFSEISKLEETIKDTMFQDKIQRQLNDISKKARILNGLFKLTLNRDDLQYYRDNKAEFAPDSMVNFVNIQAPLNDVPTSMLLSDKGFLDKVGDVIMEGEKFYTIAVERDVSLVENTLRVMDERKKQSAAMVVGGFHTEGVLSLFEAKGVGYAVITPKIVKAGEEGLYLSLMMDKRIHPVEEGSSLAFPKLLPDGENVARIVVPLGAEGWRLSLLEMAMRVYNKYLGREVVEEINQLPFTFTVKPDGTIEINRNPDYADAETPNMMVEWFRLGLDSVLSEDADLTQFITKEGNAEKYLGRPAIVEYRLRTGHTVSEGLMRRATLEFIEFYLQLCKIYEETGWIGVQNYLGAKTREFIPESIKQQEFREGEREITGKREFIDKLTTKAGSMGLDMNREAIEGFVNYLFSMPAYNVNEKGEIYETLFFSSYLNLLRDTFDIAKDPELQRMLDNIQVYRFLQVYLAGLFGVDKVEILLIKDDVNKIIGEYSREGRNGDKVSEIVARYFAGEKFPGEEEKIKTIIKRKIPEGENIKWIKAAGSVSVESEGKMPDALKRKVYVTTIAKDSITTEGGEADLLKASDEYGKFKARLESDLKLKPEEELINDLTGRLFIHDVSIDIGEAERIAEGKYKISDLGSQRIRFINAIQHSKNEQYFLCKDGTQRDAAIAYYRSKGINVRSDQFKLIGEYNTIPKENRVVVVMLSDEIPEISPSINNRVVIGKDPILMTRMPLVLAGPDNIKGVGDVADEVRRIINLYCGDASTDKEVISFENGILKIILPPITPFVREYYDALIRSREVIAIAA